ncbi:MAG: hypothetical protein AB7L90_22090 [Hyphomicrobiaceae bacterium]
MNKRRALREMPPQVPIAGKLCAPEETARFHGIPELTPKKCAFLLNEVPVNVIAEALADHLCRNKTVIMRDRTIASEHTGCTTDPGNLVRLKLRADLCGKGKGTRKQNVVCVDPRQKSAVIERKFAKPFEEGVVHTFVDF